MKISSIVIALSLIGAPLPASAQFYEGSGHGAQYQESGEEAEAYAKQNAMERKAKADKLARALAIKDEEVRNFPTKDVDCPSSEFLGQGAA